MYRRLHQAMGSRRIPLCASAWPPAPSSFARTGLPLVHWLCLRCHPRATPVLSQKWLTAPCRCKGQHGPHFQVQRVTRTDAAATDCRPAKPAHNVRPWGRFRPEVKTGWRSATPGQNEEPDDFDHDATAVEPAPARVLDLHPVTVLFEAAAFHLHWFHWGYRVFPLQEPPRLGINAYLHLHPAPMRHEDQQCPATCLVSFGQPCSKTSPWHGVADSASTYDGVAGSKVANILSGWGLFSEWPANRMVTHP